VRWLPALAVVPLTLGAMPQNTVVLRLSAPASMQQAAKDALGIVFRSAVVTEGKWELIESDRVDEVAREHALSDAGCLDSSCVFDAAKLLQAQRILELDVTPGGGNCYDAHLRSIGLAEGESTKDASIRCVNFSDLTYFIRYNPVMRKGSLELGVDASPWTRRSAGLQFELLRGLGGDAVIDANGYGFGAGLRLEAGILRAMLIGGSHTIRLAQSRDIDGVRIHPDTSGELATVELRCGVDVWPGVGWEVTPYGLLQLSKMSFTVSRTSADGRGNDVVLERNLPWVGRIGFGLEFSRKFWAARVLEFSSTLGWQASWGAAGNDGLNQAGMRQRLQAGVATCIGHP